MRYLVIASIVSAVISYYVANWLDRRDHADVTP